MFRSLPKKLLSKSKELTYKNKLKASKQFYLQNDNKQQRKCDEIDDMAIICTYNLTKYRSLIIYFMCIKNKFQKLF